jgi:hypothetical protein
METADPSHAMSDATLNIPLRQGKMEAPPHNLSSRANSGFPTTLLSETTTYAAFFEESRTTFTETTKSDRKSGGSRGTCSFSSPQVELEFYRNP